jgi:hypothetical protein
MDIITTCKARGTTNPCGAIIPNTADQRLAQGRRCLHGLVDSVGKVLGTLREMSVGLIQLQLTTHRLKKHFNETPIERMLFCVPESQGALANEDIKDEEGTMEAQLTTGPVPSQEPQMEVNKREQPTNEKTKAVESLVKLLWDKAVTLAESEDELGRNQRELPKARLSLSQDVNKALKLILQARQATLTMEELNALLFVAYTLGRDGPKRTGSKPCAWKANARKRVDRLLAYAKGSMKPEKAAETSHQLR